MKPSAVEAAFILALTTFPLRGQQPLVGSIYGVVKDRNGRPVAEASVTAANLDRSAAQNPGRGAETDAQGSYRFVDVPEGRYSIRIERSGYRPVKIPEITVHGGQNAEAPEISLRPAKSL